MVDVLQKPKAVGGHCIRAAFHLDSEVGFQDIGRAEPNFLFLSHALITFSAFSLFSPFYWI